MEDYLGTHAWLDGGVSDGWIVCRYVTHRRYVRLGRDQLVHSLAALLPPRGTGLTLSRHRLVPDTIRRCLVRLIASEGGATGRVKACLLISRA
jgi:hypothetical protein